MTTCQSNPLSRGFIGLESCTGNDHFPFLRATSDPTGSFAFRRPSVRASITVAWYYPGKQPRVGTFKLPFRPSFLPRLVRSIARLELSSHQRTCSSLCGTNVQYRVLKQNYDNAKSGDRGGDRVVMGVVGAGEGGFSPCQNPAHTCLFFIVFEGGRLNERHSIVRFRSEVDAPTGACFNCEGGLGGVGRSGPLHVHRL